MAAVCVVCVCVAAFYLFVLLSLSCFIFSFGYLSGGLVFFLYAQESKRNKMVIVCLFVCLLKVMIVRVCYIAAEQRRRQVGVSYIWGHECRKNEKETSHHNTKSEITSKK